MAYDSRVYRILIASPSDVEQEREIAVRVIQEWNDLYSFSRKIVLLPLRWETHTAPEYGTRPQEVINRAIVDECDLLIGAFWTRIGSPTGLAESGTLEEIERVGTAGKPVMLYFSRIEIDPERIDVIQIEKLKAFKKKAYPEGLIENYQTIIEFRDKFARQLELKVRDLQRNDTIAAIPLSLEFISGETSEVVGSDLTQRLEYPEVANLDAVPAGVFGQVRELIGKKIKEQSYSPIILGIRNASPSVIRNIFVELYFRADSPSLELTDSVPGDAWSGVFIFIHSTLVHSQSEIAKNVRQVISKFEPEGLQRENADGSWKLTYEWDALQPQRLRLVKPVLYVSSKDVATLSISGRVYSDTFPEPFKVSATFTVIPEPRHTDLLSLIPDLEERMKEAASSDPSKPLRYAVRAYLQDEPKPRRARPTSKTAKDN